MSLPSHPLTPSPHTGAPPTGSAPSGRGSSRLGYQRQLDGWRGIGILMVMLYHGGLRTNVPGAFLWIDGFFTLSAFLITTLLLEEHAGKGRIDLVAFWARRIRRLAPALIITLAGMGLYATVADRVQRASLNGDVLGTLFYVANWRSIAAGSDYFAAYTADSPLKHTWSLAIEEQFYLIFPLLLLGVFWLAKRSRRDPAVVLGWVSGAGAALSAVWMLWLHHSGASASRLYYGTDTRAQSLLVGVLLAVVWRLRPVRAATPVAKVVGGAGIGCFVALVAAQFFVYEDTPNLYSGGFLLAAVAQGVVFAAALSNRAFKAFLSWRPFVWVGGMAYGLYLFHFPMFLWLSPERTHADGVSLLAIRFAATFAVAIPVFRFIETPVRARRWPARGSPASKLAWPVAVAVLAAVAVGFPAPPASPSSQELVALVSTTTATTGKAPTGIPAGTGGEPGGGPGSTAAPEPTRQTRAPKPPPRVAVVGDSTGTRLVPGVEAWAKGTGALVWTGDATRVGCPLGRGGMMHTAADALGPVNVNCDWMNTNATGADGTARPSYPALVAGWEPDLVIASFGPWDVADRQINGDPAWVHAGDRVYDDWLLGEMQLATDTLAARGAHVVWLTSPRWEGATRHPPERLYAPAADPARMDAFNAVLRRLADSRPGTVSVVEYAAWIEGTGEDARLRPDGAHLEPETAVEVLNDFLGAELTKVWQEA